MKTEAAVSAMRDANPVPDAARFKQTRSSSADFLQATIERSEHMTKTVKNKQQTRVEPEPEATGRDPVGLPRRQQGGRRPLVAIAAVVVVVVIGAAAAIFARPGHVLCGHCRDDLPEPRDRYGPVHLFPRGWDDERLDEPRLGHGPAVGR